MHWKGKDLRTMGELMDTALAIFQSGDTAEGIRFQLAYRQITPHADANLGYGSGYFDNETRLAFQKFFGVTHPYFGDKAVTQEEALKIGLELGKKAREERG